MPSSELLRQHWHVLPIFTWPQYAEEGFLHLLIDVKTIRRERRRGSQGKNTNLKIGHLQLQLLATGGSGQTKNKFYTLTKPVMLSTSLQLTIIPCGRKEPFRGEPASSALYMGMLILPHMRGQGEVPALPTLKDNLSCHPNTPPDYFGQLTQEGFIPPVLLAQVAQSGPHQEYLKLCENGLCSSAGHPLTTHNPHQ